VSAMTNLAEQLGSSPSAAGTRSDCQADVVVFLADGGVVDTMTEPSLERVAERVTRLET
jgi:hypothetical protein